MYAAHIMIRLRHYFLVASAALLLVAAAPAMAADAVLNTFSYFPLPKQGQIEIEVLDDTVFNLSVADEFERALGERFEVAEGQGRLVFSFETIERFTPDANNRVGEFSFDSAQGMSLRLNMWSSTGDSVLKRRPGEGGSGRFVIIAVLYDREESRRVWEAEATAPAAARNQERSVRDIVRLVAGSVGETVRKQRYPLP
jgi:hypothetical protein